LADCEGRAPGVRGTRYARGVAMMTVDVGGPRGRFASALSRARGPRRELKPPETKP